jgi:hypothetical protein
MAVIYDVNLQPQWGEPDDPEKRPCSYCGEPTHPPYLLYHFWASDDPNALLRLCTGCCFRQGRHLIADIAEVKQRATLPRQVVSS